MKRTNVNLNEDQHDYLKSLAEREGKSISELIRELVEASRGKQTRQSQDDPIYGVIGLSSSDGKLKAEDHDELLYPKRRSR